MASATACGPALSEFQPSVPNCSLDVMSLCFPDPSNTAAQNPALTSARPAPQYMALPSTNQLGTGSCGPSPKIRIPSVSQPGVLTPHPSPSIPSQTQPLAASRLLLWVLLAGLLPLTLSSPSRSPRGGGHARSSQGASWDPVNGIPNAKSAFANQPWWVGRRDGDFEQLRCFPQCWGARPRPRPAWVQAELPLRKRSSS